MSKPHLSHKIPWSELIDCCKNPDTSAVYLPIGECGLIHITDKSTKIQIDNRNYINKNQICTLLNCKTTSTKGFSKKKSVLPILLINRSKHFKIEIKNKLIHFTNKFYDVIMEFAETEKQKCNYLTENIKIPTDSYIKEYFDKLQTHQYMSKNDKIVLLLFFEKDLATLLYMHANGAINISEAFATTFGGQAVGRGYNFLMLCYIIPFYLTANAIITSGYQHNKLKWGLLGQKYFYSNMLYDCDFFTFIPCLRPYLYEHVFMIDLEKTDQLLKEIFKYIYIFALLSKESGYVHFLNDVQQCISSTFNFYGIYDD